MKLESRTIGIATLFLAVSIAALTSCGYKGADYVTAPAPSPGPNQELNSGDIAPGATFEHRFAVAGTFPYHCIHHPMNGSVAVSATAADTLVNVIINTNDGPFPAASVKPGGRVVWTNNTLELHTVTSD